MSAGAIRFYGIPRVIIGENKTYHGDEALLRASSIQVDVLDSYECQEIMENYIKENPLVWNENTAR
jgi:cytosine deaminase